MCMSIRVFVCYRRATSNVFLYCSPPCFLETESLTKPQCPWGSLARLRGQQAPEILAAPLPQCWDYRDTLLHLDSNTYILGGLNNVANTLLTKPFPQHPSDPLDPLTAMKWTWFFSTLQLRYAVGRTQVSLLTACTVHVTRARSLYSPTVLHRLDSNQVTRPGGDHFTLSTTSHRSRQQAAAL